MGFLTFRLLLVTIAEDIDERRRYTKKMHPLKAWVGLSIVKRGRREGFIGWVGVEGVCGYGS